MSGGAQTPLLASLLSALGTCSDTLSSLLSVSTLFFQTHVVCMHWLPHLPPVYVLDSTLTLLLWGFSSCLCPQRLILQPVIIHQAMPSTLVFHGVLPLGSQSGLVSDDPHLRFHLIPRPELITYERKLTFPVKRGNWLGCPLLRNSTSNGVPSWDVLKDDFYWLDFHLKPWRST